MGCMQFSLKHNKIYVKHRVVMVCNLLVTEMSLCDISYTALLTLASFFWANPLCFAAVANCPHILQQTGLRKLGLKCLHLLSIEFLSPLAQYLT